MDWIDSNRLAVAGASYGGFAALPCLTRLPDLWTAGISLCGPSNLVTLAAACPPTWRAFVNIVLGDPAADARRATHPEHMLTACAVGCPVMAEGMRTVSAWRAVGRSPGWGPRRTCGGIPG